MNDLLIVIVSISVFVLFLIIIGEWHINQKASEKLKLQNKIYQHYSCKELITNLSLPVEKNFWGGRTETTIDYLIFTNQNLLCINYVCLQGYIYGNEVTKIWWSVTSESEKEKFINPMEIAYMQSEEIKKIIEINVKVIPIVVFRNDCNLEYVKKVSKDIFLMKEGELLKYLNELPRNKVLTKKMIKEIENELILSEVN